MAFGSLKIFSNSREQLGWLSKRQRVLSENLANATTPGYRARDLQTPHFPGVKTSLAGQKIPLRQPDQDTTLRKPLLSGPIHSYFIHSDEQKLSGNTVIQEDEVKKINETSMLHQQVINIYKQQMANLSAIF
jgi:flagellar basal-body rod protein FlgB